MGWQNNDVSAAAGAPPAELSPSVAGYVFAAQGTQHVIYIGANDGHLHELWWDTNGWHHDDLTAATGAPDANQTVPFTGYAFNTQATQHVIYVGLNDNHIYELWWSASDGWQLNDVTAAAGAPVLQEGFGVVGYAFEAQFTQHIFHTVPYGGIRELWWDGTDGTWQYDNLPAANVGYSAVPGFGVWAYPFEKQRTQHVIASDVNSHLIEQYWDINGWHINDLTAATGAPNNDGYGPAGYAFEAQGTQHVISVDNDFHMYELWWDSNGWHADDLSGPSGAPNYSSSTPFVGYAFEAQGTQHVIYYGSNGLHELWWDSNGWHDNGLSAGGTSSTIAAYAFEAQGTQHVFYVGSDAHVHELWWSP
jgi:hypothetical protein